jgi:hypothetical protein
MLIQQADAQEAVDHVPTETEYQKSRTGIRSDSERQYLQRSIETNQYGFRGILLWIREKIRRIHLTPARLCLGLGILGTFYSAGKNKHIAKWAVLSIVSLLLIIIGICAMVFHWPQMN